MGFVKPDIQKERCVGITLLGQPRHRLVDDNLAGIAFDPSDRLAVANEVHGIPMAGLSVVSRREPIIKAMIRGCRLFAFLRRHAKMPLTQVHGFVTVVFQYLRHGDFSFQQVRVLVVVVNPTVDACAEVLPSGQ